MSGKIPREFIDELLARIDIVEVIDQRVPLTKGGKDFKACCPFHNENTPSFTVSSTKQFYHCFGCNANGSAIGFLMEFDRLSFVEAIEELAQSAGLEMPDTGPQRAPDTVTPALLESLSKANHFFKEQLHDVEDCQGRQRTQDSLTSRLIDIDLLLYGDSVLYDQGMDVPRREILKYAHVLKPLSLVLPDVCHPVSGRRYHELWGAMSASQDQLLELTDLEL